MVSFKIGDKVVVRTDKRYFTAKVTDVWPDTYDPSKQGVVEIQYDSLFGTVRELIDPCYVKGVKSRE